MVLAKEVIQSQRAVNKLYATKAHMNSVMLGMKNQCGEFGTVAFSAKLQFGNLSRTDCALSQALFLIIKANFSVFLSCSTCRWVAAEEHRGDESHAEPDQSTRDSCHHEGVIKRDDKG